MTVVAPGEIVPEVAVVTVIPVVTAQGGEQSAERDGACGAACGPSEAGRRRQMTTANDTRATLRPQADGGLAAWLESKRPLTRPERHIDTMRCLLAEDDDALLLHEYDLTSDPQTVAVVRAQRRAAGQRRRRLRRLATRRRSAK
ncbi:hypothetical protein GCM10010269_45010 [Streptomyces humidus]|uniref:Uncharacterized protein n=1 Tax=Streptomyces humidus TaxID=52259 RepID=A0A918L524_9ACTN|nr:hypothetical protein GCM10010269_45010 [Streptomyces humidus]